MMWKTSAAMVIAAAVVCLPSFAEAADARGDAGGQVVTGEATGAAVDSPLARNIAAALRGAGVSANNVNRNHAWIYVEDATFGANDRICEKSPHGDLTCTEVRE